MRFGGVSMQKNRQRIAAEFVVDIGGCGAVFPFI